MLDLLKVLAVISTAIAMAPSLAHALELPGKRRLGRETYLAVQPIYYPGFTWAGAAEPIAIIAVAAVLTTTPLATTAFWLTAAALVAAIATHALYWTLTAPVNKFWLQDSQLSTSAQRFFGAAADGRLEDCTWTTLRDRWERSHVYRAATAMLALVLMVTAVVV